MKAGDRRYPRGLARPDRRAREARQELTVRWHVEQFVVFHAIRFTKSAQIATHMPKYHLSTPVQAAYNLGPCG